MAEPRMLARDVIQKPPFIRVNLTWEGCRQIEGLPGVEVEYDGNGNPVSVKLPANAATTVTVLRP